MRRVFNFGGGLCSWAAARRVAEWFGTDELTILFADTLIEDDDLYRFLIEAAADIFGQPRPQLFWLDSLPSTSDIANRKLVLRALRDEAMAAIPGLVWIADGRTPWDVFRDERFLGNTRVDPCSRILKRELLNNWHETNCDPEKTVIYVGLSWDEGDRFNTFSERIKPWQVCAPLYHSPYVTKDGVARMCTERGIVPPRLHLEGFPHNNCGGGCVKAGQAHFAHLLRMRPSTFDEWEKEEKGFIDFIGKPVSILRDRRGGEVKPLTLAEFRERISGGQSFDQFEWGGCGCAV